MTRVDGANVRTTKGDRKMICGVAVLRISVRKGHDL